MYHLVNNGIGQQVLSITGPNGEQKEIFLQPRGKMNLPPFWKLSNGQEIPPTIFIKGEAADVKHVATKDLEAKDVSKTDSSNGQQNKNNSGNNSFQKRNS